MYDFTYRSPNALTLGALLTPLKIEGAPDHGTIADAQVWADHYEVQIDLLDGTGRVRRIVGPDGQVRDLKTVWFDAISPSGVEMATARALRESVERMGCVAEKMRAAGITRESAIRFRAKWLERYPQMRDYFVVRGADRAMSGKTAFADDPVGLRRVFCAGRPDEVRRQGAEAQVIDYKYPRPTSLSYSTIASFRGQTCPGQFEVKRTASARARHLSGVSVDLLIALGHSAPRLGFWGPNEVDLFDANGGT